MEIECETCDIKQEENLDEIVKLKFLLKEISTNIKELNEIKITPKNLDLQKIKQDLETAKQIDTPATFGSTSKYILTQVENYLKKNCNHNYIEDFYDFGEDNCKKIIYCNKCYYNY